MGRLRAFLREAKGRGVAQVKNLATGEQEAVALADIAARLA